MLILFLCLFGAVVGNVPPPPDPTSAEFSKKSGEPLTDQLAVESVEHRHQVPVPVPMHSFPGTMVLPVPPGFQQMGQGQPPRQRVPMFQQQQQRAPPHHPPPKRPQPIGDFQISKGKEIFSSAPVTVAPSVAPPVHRPELNNHRLPPEGKILSKPPRPLTSDAQLANSVFRELFEEKKRKKFKPDLLAEGGGHQEVFQQYGVPPVGGAGVPAIGGAFPTVDADMPKIVSLEVKCEKNVMRVYIAFDQPFHGVIFSKGHYHNINCIHLPAGLGHTSANFDIAIETCGTQGNTENGLYGHGTAAGSGSFFENIIVIQYDSQVQEVWDQARKLRCTWHDQYEKSVTFRPFPVDMLDVVRADFAGDNVGCWMQIQVGKGPWATEVSGLVKIGQTMTMVLAIKDDDSKFDMLVRNCMAHDGVRAPIQLVDQTGCITRPKLMTRFTKIKNFGQSASVLSYAHFQAFKFPDSMEVHFQCTIQICRFQCPEQCSGEPAPPSGGYREKRERFRRDTLNVTLDQGMEKFINVYSKEDFVGEVEIVEEGKFMDDVICMSTFGFSSLISIVLGTLCISCCFSLVLYRRRK